MFKSKVGFQFFADAGTLVNATGNYVNAGTGQTTAFSGNDTLAPTMKTFYDTQLLENVRPDLYHAQFAEKQALPRNHGKTVEWRKWNTLKDAETLTEGVIPTGQKMGQSSMNASIEQIGTYVTISDQLELHALDNMILGATEELGASAALSIDKRVRNVVVAGHNVQYCDKVSSSGTHTAVTGRSGLDKTALLTPLEINKAVTTLKKLGAKPINGKYVAIIHPSVSFDLRNSDGWVEAHKYAAVTEIFNGEIGELHGVRFIENSFAPVLGVKGATADDDDSYVNQERGRTYATYFFGKDAFGIIDPEGGALEMIIHDKGEIGGPLNQFSTIGYKFETNGATILYPERLLRVMSVSSFSATDEVN